MAVVSVSISDAGEVSRIWQVPPQREETFIPRGLYIHQGSTPIAAKGAADQTRFELSLTFDDRFCYVLRNLAVFFGSDDQVNDFAPQGGFHYEGTTVDPIYELTSDGLYYRTGALKAERSYHFPGGRTPRNMHEGKDNCRIYLADVSSDVSSAGDVFWHVDWLVYDIEQCKKFPVNTPQPVLQF